jgi:hypothetical protein
MANRLVALAKASVEYQASRHKADDISRQDGEKPPSAGRPKDLVKEKAVELGKQHGISERTIERATAKAAGKTPQPASRPRGHVPLDDPSRPTQPRCRQARDRIVTCPIIAGAARGRSGSGPDRAHRARTCPRADDLHRRSESSLEQRRSGRAK